MIEAQPGYPNKIIAWFAGAFAPDQNSEPAQHEEAEQRSPRNNRAIEVIDFLEAIKMDPTPENYELAWEYQYGASSRFRQAIDDTVSERGYLSDSAASELTAIHLNRWNASEIAKIVARGTQVMHNGRKVIRQSCADNQNFGRALEVELSTIDITNKAGAPNVDEGRQFTALIDLTKRMAVKSFEAQRQLEEANESLASMRGKLADATEQAETDQLTGLPNRWSFEKRLEDALLRSREAMEPLSIAFVDVDHFKAINDTHGHEAGDRVLKRIAQALDELSNNNCHVARHGGEEFVILFCDTSSEQAQEIMNAARTELGEHDFTNRENGQKSAK